MKHPGSSVCNGNSHGTLDIFFYCNLKIGNFLVLVSPVDDYSGSWYLWVVRSVGVVVLLGGGQDNGREK